jgi:putative hydrolase of the HAD superfamily
MTICAVFFDLDGTLLDRRETFRRHLELQLQRHEGIFSEAEAPRYVARLLELDNNGTLDRDKFHELVEADLGLPPGSADVLRDDFESHFPESCVPLPSLFETLGLLCEASLKLGVITNGRDLIQRRKIERLGVEPYLDLVFISETLGFRKPDHRIFAAALSALAVEPSAAVYVGDNPETDIIGAKQSGLVAIWRRDDFWSEPVEADHVIDDLSAVPGIVAAYAAGKRPLS